MRRVTVDSNVYISALVFRGRPMELLELAADRKIQIAISNAILGEVSRILSGGKFRWAADRVAEALEWIGEITEHVTPTQTLTAVKEDPADNRILECAVEGKCDYLVTGDKDLLRLKSHGSISIVQAADFLDIEQGKAGQSM